MPTGGDGFYYFSTYLLVDSGEYGSFDIQINGETICTARNEQEQTTTDPGPATCSTVTYATQGISISYLHYIEFTYCTKDCVLHFLFLCKNYFYRRHCAGCVHNWHQHNSYLWSSLLLLHWLHRIQNIKTNLEKWFRCFKLKYKIYLQTVLFFENKISILQAYEE